MTILEQAREQAERARQIAEMEAEQKREIEEVKLRHSVERLLGRRVKGHWCMQAYRYYGGTTEQVVYVVENVRFALLKFDGEKATLRAWGEWDSEEGRPWWSSELHTLADLAKVQFDPPAEEGAAA